MVPEAMSDAMVVREGSISFAGFRTWYWVVGGEQTRRDRLPLLVLHGGPGLPHGYLKPLEGLAAGGREVVFYDQLGCGKSTTPSSPARWTLDLYLQEVEAIRQALALEQLHVLGFSWGGMVAMEYALTQPPGLRSLVLSDTLASMSQVRAEIARLRSELPEEVRRTLERHAAAGTTDDPEYQRAAAVFEQRHMYGIDPVPAYVTEAFDQCSDEVNQALLGPEGALKDWDITDRLREISVPTLVLVGRHGHATPAVAETIHHGIGGSTLVVLEKGAHLSYLAETAKYLDAVNQFLDGVEAGGAAATDRAV